MSKPLSPVSIQLTKLYQGKNYIYILGRTRCIVARLGASNLHEHWGPKSLQGVDIERS